MRSALDPCCRAGMTRRKHGIEEKLTVNQEVKKMDPSSAIAVYVRAVIQ